MGSSFSEAYHNKAAGGLFGNTTSIFNQGGGTIFNQGNSLFNNQKSGTFGGGPLQSTLFAGTGAKDEDEEDIVRLILTKQKLINDKELLDYLGDLFE